MAQSKSPQSFDPARGAFDVSGGGHGTHPQGKKRGPRAVDVRRRKRLRKQLGRLSSRQFDRRADKGQKMPGSMNRHKSTSIKHLRG